MLTVMTWLWTQPGGRTDYTAGMVNTWAAMVRRHLILPHRIACVTDIPDGIDPSIAIIAPPRDFEDVRIPTWGSEKPQCLRRVAMFAPDAAARFGDRFVSMDMDCVIAGSLDPLFERREDIVLYQSPPGSLWDGRPYNGSMLMMTAGARPKVFNTFSERGAIEAGKRFRGSDQAWISHVLGAGEAVWNEADGVVWWGRWHPTQNPRLCFFPGYPKPWDLLDDNDWVAQHYRGDRKGRCLVLGYAPSVWMEAERALQSGRFDAVIASPEAAEHWPDRQIMIARDDAHADKLSKGFAEVIWCGRTMAA